MLYAKAVPCFSSNDSQLPLAPCTIAIKMEVDFPTDAKEAQPWFSNHSGLEIPVSVPMPIALSNRQTVALHRPHTIKKIISTVGLLDIKENKK